MRILGAIWLTQTLTVLVFWSSTHGLETSQIALFGTIILGIGALAAIWIQSTLKDQLKLNDAVHNERLTRKSMELRRELSKQKAAETQRLAELVRNTASSQTGLLRVGIFSGGVLGIGAALVMAQFVGMALVLAAFSGGGLAGYAISKKVRSPRLVNNSPGRFKKYWPRLWLTA
jgi:hypothetical protein